MARKPTKQADEPANKPVAKFQVVHLSKDEALRLHKAYSARMLAESQLQLVTESLFKKHNIDPGKFGIDPENGWFIERKDVESLGKKS